MHQSQRATHPGARVSPWRATLAGACASLVGIGLARFAYTPLIPALITAGWFTPSQAAYLGAANFAGYLVGALLARRLAARASAAIVLRAMMALATMAFFACAVSFSFPWFFAWRFASGFSGGVLMVVAATAVLPLVAPARRGLVAGAIFMGVGLGVIASGTLVPLLLRWGVVETWCGLGAISLLLTALAWREWPTAPVSAAAASPARPPSNSALKPLYIAYGLCAFGLVPHMVFLADFIARGLGQGVDVGARYWVLFGLGAMAGPLLAGYAADRIGFGPALRIALLVQAAAVALPAIAPSPGWLIVSSVVMGAFVPGNVPLVLGRVYEIVRHDANAQRGAWSVATSAFALAQAAAGYGFSFLYSRTADYALLFELGACALVLAFLTDSGAAIASRRRAAEPSP